MQIPLLANADDVLVASAGATFSQMGIQFNFGKSEEIVEFTFLPIKLAIR